MNRYYTEIADDKSKFNSIDEISFISIEPQL